MKYDQVDAFLSGLLSGPVRVILGLVTMWLLLYTCIFVAGHLDLGFDEPILSFLSVIVSSFVGIIFWFDNGMWLILGIFLFVAQWGSFYAFVVSDNTKLWWFLLAFFATALYLPVALGGHWWIIICGFVGLSIFYWLPDLIVVYKNKS